MPVTTLTSREFNQDTGRAKKAAGPVFITDRGKPAHVLLSIAEYRRLTEQEPSIVDVLGWPPGVEDIEIEFPRSGDLPRAADFS